MHKICIAGIGPGALEYVTPAALKVVRGCDILVGGRRNLDLFRNFNKETYEFKNKLDDLLVFINEVRRTKKVCLVVSGDPGFYSLLDFFCKRLGEDQLEVIPGISSFQYLFAKLARSWKDFSLCSLHGRKIDIQKNLEEKGGLFLLTDREHTPSWIARYLNDHGMEFCTMVVGENLSYDDERIVKGDPKEIELRNDFSDLCVVVVEKNDLEL